MFYSALAQRTLVLHFTSDTLRLLLYDAMATAVFLRS